MRRYQESGGASGPGLGTERPFLNYASLAKKTLSFSELSTLAQFSGSQYNNMLHMIRIWCQYVPTVTQSGKTVVDPDWIDSNATIETYRHPIRTNEYIKRTTWGHTVLTPRMVPYLSNGSLTYTRLYDRNFAYNGLSSNYWTSGVDCDVQLFYHFYKSTITRPVYYPDVKYTAERYSKEAGWNGEGSGQAEGFVTQRNLHGWYGTIKPASAVNDLQYSISSNGDTLQSIMEVPFVSDSYLRLRGGYNMINYIKTRPTNCPLFNGIITDLEYTRTENTSSSKINANVLFQHYGQVCSMGTEEGYNVRGGVYVIGILIPRGGGMTDSEI